MYRTKRIRKYDVNSISTFYNIVFNIIVAVFSAMCFVPFILILSVSFTDERAISLNGFQFLPSIFSVEAYRYIFTYGLSIVNAYGVSIFITMAGTALSVFFNSMYAYALSRNSFRMKKLFSFIAIFTLLYNGGLVAFYIVCTRIVSFNNNVLSLFMPYVVNAFYIMILRTYFMTNIHESIIEAAKIDGATELGIFSKIVMKISLPGLATIGLLSSITFWNDWMLSLLFIEKPSLYPLQYLLMRIVNSIAVIQSVVSTTGGGYLQKQLDIMPVETARMALVVVVLGPIVLAYPFFQRYFIKGLNLGAVKG